MGGPITAAAPASVLPGLDLAVLRRLIGRNRLPSFGQMTSPGSRNSDFGQYARRPGAEGTDVLLRCFKSFRGTDLAGRTRRSSSSAETVVAGRFLQQSRKFT